MNRISIFASGAAFSFLVSSASAALVWDEAVNGNLSNNRMAPTALTVKAGINTFRGSLTGNFGDGMYYDYVTFQVPARHALTGFTVDALTSQNSGATIVGIASGVTFPSDQNGLNASQMLGWTSVSPASVGRDFFLQLAKPDNGNVGNSGFTDFLPAGNYSFWVQDYNTPATYQFSFRIEPTVAPAIKVKGRKVGRNKVTLSGLVGGTGTTVSYRVGSKGAFKPAKGRAPDWKIVASKLKEGANVITIRATGLFGVSTKKETVVIKKD